MTPPARQPVTDSVKQFLIDYTGKPIEVGEAPTLSGDAQTVADPPYAIIYPILGGGFWGPIYSDPESCADFSYQVTSIGLRYDQCQWMADKVRAALVGRQTSGAFVHNLTVTGLVVADRRIDGGASGPTLNGRIYSQPDTYIISVVPAN